MKSFKIIERIRYVDYLIQSKSTGTPEELAAKLNISQRQLYRILHYLKEMDAPVSYCKCRKTYFYQKKFNINL